MNQDTNNMENKLTNEEIAKVFAMYYGQSIVVHNSNTEGKTGSPVKNALALYVLHGEFNYKLLLTPLSEVSDEDAEAIVTIAYPLYTGSRDKVLFGKSIIKELSADLGLGSTRWSAAWGILNYLIQQGYAVPLFFGINHWANGKTAIELNIAIKK